VIDWNTEEMLTMAQAAAEVPHTGRGRTHVSTVYRWALRGVHGVRLSTLQCGGTTFTSRQALQRFFEELTRRREAAKSGQEVAQVTHGVYRSAARRQRDSERAARLLESMGV
jgi:hypothetical protein